MNAWLLLVLFISLSGCDIEFESSFSEKPEKPDSVSETALWIGGPDGGAFVDIFETEKKGVYKGTIYYDYTGEVWYQGRFEYTGNEAFDPTKKSSYTGWDGTHLYLANQERLIAVGVAEK